MKDAVTIQQFAEEDSAGFKVAPEKKKCRKTGISGAAGSLSN
jgi:hypothetical protein